MTVVCGDGKRTWVDVETLRQPTRASFSQKALYGLNRSKAADDVLFMHPLSLWLRLEAGSSPTKQIACCCVD